ncbi:conserved hypothetical protein [Theileria orientalis strain Shintoku]|uniref:Uncharacterized protein n=1 Tax=Theileria orientalis strain Shintoku TaxID=869250 RepID=J4C8D8_THEOR|nr:conserved hypothetical protein [Theileria orientalis strain Shintoku]BAM40613.1 conserved hypothetical protein [Theileria orientalis strain Shintoku]|eukprot:XP_009690914.1 conserved hypothetical protein [Theileria orientalis strain Shintoku]
MVLYDITISIYRKDGYMSGKPRLLDIYVSKEEQYDKLSRRINRYRHTIKYNESNYNASNYHINVYDKNALYYKYLLKYFCPKKKVISIDLFFASSDYKNTNPLVLGINHENEDPVYYTYTFLIYDTAPKLLYNADFSNLPNPSESFKEEDLITRLMVEHDLYLRRNKGDRMVIMLNTKTSNEDKITYPKTGGSKNRITVSKCQNSGSEYFDKYEHKIEPKYCPSTFYLCYDKNTLFVVHGKNFKDLICADVYYNKYYGIEPIILVLKSKDVNKLYKYSELKKDFINSNKNKNTNELEDFKENDVINKLKEENDKINPDVTYLIDKKTNYSYKVNVEERNENDLNGFTKYCHTPESSYTTVKSLILFGNNKLVKKTISGKYEEIKEIQELTYSYIEVFFGSKNDSIPLIIKLNKSESNNQYYVHNKDDSFYWEEWNFQSIVDNREILKKLKETESNLFDSISLLVDFDKEYNKNDVESKTGFKPTESQPETIKVSENSSLECLNKLNYKCYEHSLLYKTESDLSDIENLKLKLFISNGNYKYGEITLYNTDDPSDFNKEYIYYKNKKTDNNYKDNFYVFFYCGNNKEKGDPRPVLFCYQNKVYRPLNLEEYSKKWVCVKGVDFKSDFCTIPNLSETLKEVSYFLNPVNIDETTDRIIGNYKITNRYTTHNFNNSTSVQITIKPEDLNCYRKYTHSTTSGYILGEIAHNRGKLFESYEQYTKSLSNSGTVKFPDNVFVYYYLYDKGHNYPLLVGLKFPGIHTNYFKLSSKDKPLKWVRIDDSQEWQLASKNIEKLLHNIRYNLGIEYENKKDNLIIESADKCNERSNVGIIAGVISTIVLIAGGVAGAAYKFPEFFRSIYSRIN